MNSNHQTNLDKSFVVARGTSMVVTVAANMASKLDTYAGQVVKLAVTGIDAGSSAVSGSLPIMSNNMTINATLTIGTLTSPNKGSTDPSNAATKEVGTTGYTFS